MVWFHNRYDWLGCNHLGNFPWRSSQAATTESVTSAFNAMRLIVLVGWAIYPLGYLWLHWKQR